MKSWKNNKSGQNQCHMKHVGSAYMQGIAQTLTRLSIRIEYLVTKRSRSRSCFRRILSLRMVKNPNIKMTRDKVLDRYSQSVHFLVDSNTVQWGFELPIIECRLLHLTCKLCTSHTPITFYLH